MKQQRVSRRRFIGASASLTALSWSSLSRAQSSLSTIRVGVIGTGVRGKYLMGNLPDHARVIALCDCSMERIADTLKPHQEFEEVLAKFIDRDATSAKRYQDYRIMIDRERLDAMIIATPDHHHVQAAMLALDAGLDVYVEKPLSLTIREGRLLAEKVSRTKRVLQVGSQQRTMELNRFACQFIRDGGLGRVHRVDCPNYPGPITASDFDAEPIPSGLDWDLFIGPTAMRPHNRKLWIKDAFKVDELLWRGWDLFRDYSGHLMTNWGAHSIDMVQYALGMDESGPVRIAPLSSDMSHLESEQEVALDVSESALERDWQTKWHKKTPRPAARFSDARRVRPVTMKYANGTVLSFLPDVPTSIFYGERGTMRISRNKFVADPPDLIQDAPDLGLAEKWDGKGSVARPHLENWLDCIESRDVPNAPVEVGHRSVTVCNLANLVRELNRPLEWDPAAEQFVDDREANSLLDRPRRGGFELPV